jgi:DNA-binding MarR family transcriptional regulator
MTVDLEQLGRSVKRVQHRDHRALDAALRPLGISLVQWDALRAIDREPGASSHELALATFQSDQAFGTLSNRLVAAHWVERRTGHGRRLEHHPTAAGSDILARGRDEAASTWTRLFSALDETQRETLADLLDALLPSEDRAPRPSAG